MRHAWHSLDWDFISTQAIIVAVYATTNRIPATGVVAYLRIPFVLKGTSLANGFTMSVVTYRVALCSSALQLTSVGVPLRGLQLPGSYPYVFCRLSC